MKHEEDFAAIEWMVRHGSSSWTGPTPGAGRARWATRARRRSVGVVVKGSVAGVLFTALIFFSVVAVAASMAPGGISSVPRTVSNVLAMKTRRAPVAPASVSPAPVRQSEETPRPPVSPAPPAGGVAHPATPSPVPPGEVEAEGKPVAPPAAGPSPTPSHRPDD